jgi:glutathione S-transferase
MALAYVQRQLQHPSMLAWENAALQETAVEPGHEQAARGAGTLLADHRKKIAI